MPVCTHIFASISLMQKFNRQGLRDSPSIDAHRLENIPMTTERLSVRGTGLRVRGLEGKLVLYDLCA